MSRRSLFARALVVSLIALGTARPAMAGDFDEQGRFSFEPDAVLTLDFASFTPAVEPGDGAATLEEDATALAGGKVLVVALATEGYPVPLALPAAPGSYRARFWLKGDCTAGVAVDYADGSEGVVGEAFPTGRVTSDDWLEFETAPFGVDGGKNGVDARLFLSAYDRTKPVTVRLDAVEVVPDGQFAPTTNCTGLDAAKECGAGTLCVDGLCRDARGWFPPLPEESERAKLPAYWKRKLHDTFGPYELRRTTLPDALATLDQMATATDNVTYWSRFTEAIRRLRDAHTYARLTALSAVKSRRPLNACFFEGVGDLSQAAAPSELGLPDLLVSHTGLESTWGLAQGDRLVAVDGEHPITWARKLMTPSPWYWEADDPEQLANVLSLLRDLIARHATELTVVHCHAASGTCDATATTLRLDELPVVPASEAPKLVSCDNRPFFPVDGAPADHDFGDAVLTPAKVVHGPVLGVDSSEAIYGLIWNTLFGDGSKMPVDLALGAAVTEFGQARGVLLDHREGHGGTAQTANILIKFARKPYTPFIGYVRTRANDEGPASAAAAAALFTRYASAEDEFGSASARTDVPVALLTTWDVSASDYLPKILQGAPNVRLFGPGPSMGAFGTFMQYSLWGVMRWSVGIEDAITPDGTLLCTHGVDPDVRLAPTQSDLLSGKDTIAEAAIAWLRSEAHP
ncbi:MAG: S41 family peptidase [Sorangiineae bacterium]|nr:S41 family peptidase [Polyangiaceae bacterium]MEB2320897.1 S41 family peptidase [Sorangiineae bacterium]